MKIIKRNGSEAEFEQIKIFCAIQAANNEIDSKDQISEDEIHEITKSVTDACVSMKHIVTVEEVQDMVESALIERGYAELAKHYIIYRYEHMLRRKKNTTDDQILSLIECDNETVKQENSNKNPTVVSVQRDYVAGEVSKDLTRRMLVDEDIMAAHDEGLIHFHDADYFAQHMHNCFARGTRFRTTDGIKSFEDFKDGDKVIIYDKNNEEREATVHNFGTQAVQRIRLQYCDRIVAITATPDHRWILHDRKETTELKVGDVLLLAQDGNTWRVVSIEQIDEPQEVWCVTEPITHTFQLEHNIITGNCDLVNLEDMLQNSTVISQTMIERPHSFYTACNIATQIIAQVASCQYGGQSITLTHLVPFVDVSRKRIRKEVESEAEKFGSNDNAAIDEVVHERLLDEIRRGVQTIQYQVVTLMTTNGQAPFITVYMYLNEARNEQEKQDLALVIEEVLKQRYQGVKNESGAWVTPAFPKLIYVLEEDNIHPESKYFYLTELAAKCAAKRLVPDFISEKIALQYKYPTNKLTPIKERRDKWGDESIWGKNVLKNLSDDDCEKLQQIIDMYAEENASYDDVATVAHEYGLNMGDVLPKAYTCMGCVSGDELIIYRKDGKFIHIEKFADMWRRMKFEFKVKSQPSSPLDKYMDLNDIEIWDHTNGWVNCRRIIMNKRRPHGCDNDMLEVTFDNGRILHVTKNHMFETENCGVVRADELRRTDEIRIETDACWFDMMDTPMSFPTTAINIHDIYSAENKRINIVIKLLEKHGLVMRYEPLYGLDKPKLFIDIDMETRPDATMLMLLLQTLDVPAFVNRTTFFDKTDSYVTTFAPNKTMIKAISKRFHSVMMNPEWVRSCSEPMPEIKYAHPIMVREIDDEDNYDVTTESEHFTVSGVYSHNCRSFLTPDPIHYKTYGRFNQGVVTINLPDVALSSDGNESDFWTILDERLELCHRALRKRHERLLGTHSDAAPILWQYGALARLSKGETIDKLLYDGYSTISLGYAGLYECTKVMTGASHTDKEGHDFAIKVMQHLNDKCFEWREQENIHYSLYGTPLESTTYKFAKALQRRFGVIEGITDHGYITNSYHVNVREEIDAFTKLGFESEFQALSPGGAISYVETPNLQNNIEAVIAVMQFIYDHIMYAELNTKSDYCQVCGFDGEIQIVEDNGKLVWECPKCKNRDQSKLNVTRRTCGYIGTQFWNQGRTEEIRDRVLHL